MNTEATGYKIKIRVTFRPKFRSVYFDKQAFTYVKIIHTFSPKLKFNVENLYIHIDL